MGDTDVARAADCGETEARELAEDDTTWSGRVSDGTAMGKTSELLLPELDKSGAEIAVDTSNDEEPIEVDGTAIETEEPDGDGIDVSLDDTPEATDTVDEGAAEDLSALPTGDDKIDKVDDKSTLPDDDNADVDRLVPDV